MESIEFKTLRKNARDLEIALKDNICLIIHQLRDLGLVKHDVLERVQNPITLLTQEEKPGELVRSIEDDVKLLPENYFKFFKVKGVSHLFKDIVQKLRSTFCGKIITIVGGVFT